jgi:hypothetical protein
MLAMPSTRCCTVSCVSGKTKGKKSEEEEECSAALEGERSVRRAAPLATTVSCYSSKSAILRTAARTPLGAGRRRLNRYSASGMLHFSDSPRALSNVTSLRSRLRGRRCRTLVGLVATGLSALVLALPAARTVSVQRNELYTSAYTIAQNGTCARR